MEIAKKLKKIRKQQGLSQDEMAKELSVSRQTIFALESGKWLPSLELAGKICDFLDVAIDELFQEFFPRKGVKKTMQRSIIPFTHLGGISDLHREIDRFFEDSLASLATTSAPQMPPLNIHETAKEITIEAGVAGFAEDELEVELGEGYMTVKGEKTKEDEEKRKGYIKREFAHGSFSRTIGLPDNALTDDASAKMENGKLIITIPKKAPSKPKIKKIKVTKSA